MNCECYNYKNVFEIILLWKWSGSYFIRNDFLNKNALEMILQQKCTDNDFTFKINWKWFYHKNVMAIILI